jgi:acyl transferase domain-containing protein
MSALDIAIVGMAGRFPGAKDLNQFWENLCTGVESISFFDDSELEAANIDSQLLKHPNYVKANGTLEDIEYFDANFFDINPEDARVMDPQQRLFLECAWEALENAGYDSETFKGAIGVYAGAGMNTYLINLYANRNVLTPIERLVMVTSNDKDFLTTRVSYKLNLKGPSVTVQTACSTSLVAVHLACQAIISGSCDMALAGGVRVSPVQKGGYLYQFGSILSSDGHCRAFDAKASGTVGGNGLGIVVLKRLDEALADGDHIHAVIKGSDINNDGSLKVGYTAPSIEGQATVIKSAQLLAGISADTITYVETHGTGTELGDPVEIAALTEAFRTATNKKGYCAIGSVKTNIGHLDAAAGVAGLIKTVLALEHKKIPPSLHFEQPNPRIDFTNSPFYVNTKLSEWDSGAATRRAGVSSFGMGGTNVHVVLEQAPVAQQSADGRSAHLLILSAKSESTLERRTRDLIEHLKKTPEIKIADVAYTLQVGRRAFNYRKMAVCRDVEDVIEALQTHDGGRALTRFQEQKNRQVIFMFPGQGTQYVHMGQDLYRQEAVFREEVDRCSELLSPHLDLDLRSILYPPDDCEQEAANSLKQTLIAQPALFTIEYALARLWMSWGVNPHAMIGHSIGEYVAACLSGVFSLEDALYLVAVRGRLIQQLPQGSMLSVALSEIELQKILRTKKVSLAATNGPSSSVISGPTSVIESIEQFLKPKGIACRRLHTSHAFHSSMMDSILTTFVNHVKEIDLRAPRIPYISNVHGTWVTPKEVQAPYYWARHLRQTVRFFEGLSLVLQRQDSVLIEVGASQALSTLAAQHPDFAPDHVVVPSLPHVGNQSSDWEFLLEALGRIWLAGLRVNWSGIYSGKPPNRLPLPTYPFERQRFWVDLEPAAKDKIPAGNGNGRIAETGDRRLHPVQADPSDSCANFSDAPSKPLHLAYSADSADPVEGAFQQDKLANTMAKDMKMIIDNQLKLMSLQLKLLQEDDLVDSDPRN